MKIKVIFTADTDQERAVLTALKVPVDRCDGERAIYGEPERIHRMIGAFIDIMKQIIVP